MRFTLTILAAFAAFSFSASAQSDPRVAAKPEAPAVAPKSPAAKPPVIETSKLWRLLVQAQQLRQQAAQTPQAKAADKADEAVAAEQERLAGICGSGFVLGYETDAKSERYQDLACVAKPADAPKQGK